MSHRYRATIARRSFYTARRTHREHLVAACASECRSLRSSPRAQRAYHLSSTPQPQFYSATTPLSVARYLWCSTAGEFKPGADIRSWSLAPRAHLFSDSLNRLLHHSRVRVVRHFLPCARHPLPPRVLVPICTEKTRTWLGRKSVSLRLTAGVAARVPAERAYLTRIPSRTTRDGKTWSTWEAYLLFEHTGLERLSLSLMERRYKCFRRGALLFSFFSSSTALIRFPSKWRISRRSQRGKESVVGAQRRVQDDPRPRQRGQIARTYRAKRACFDSDQGI